MEKELYILGLVITDGFKNQGNYCIELKDEDKNVLEQISENFESILYHRTRDTNFMKNYSCTKLVIKDTALNSFLNNFIPQENKTINAYIPEQFLFSPALWRGILDGDGSYGYRSNTPFVGFVTKSEKLKEAFCAVVKKIVGQELIASRNKRDEVYNLGLTSVNAKIFIQWLLKADTFYIQRKKEKMNSILEWQPKGRQGESHRRWTLEEDDFVFTHSNQECVDKLGRTLASIKNRRTKLNKERKGQ